MFDPKLYREACRELRAPEDKIEEIIAMTEKTNKKKLRPLRTALIAAAVAAFMVVGVAAANPEEVQELFYNIGSVIQINRYRSDVTTEDGQTFSMLAVPEAKIENRDGKAILIVNGEETADITDALAQDQHYVFEDYSDDTRVTITVDGTIDEWNIEAEMGIVREDGTYERFGSVRTSSEDEDNLGGAFFNGSLLDGRDVNVADVEVTTGMYVTVDK